MSGVRWDSVVVQHRAGPKIGPATFAADPGRVLGLVGANGAGKTTVLKAVCGLVRLRAGVVTVAGRPVRPGVMPDDVGAMIEEPQFLPRATAWENLALAAAGRPDRLSRRASLLEFVGLTGREHEQVRAYSQGMRQRLGIARALLGDPGVVVLDEPTNGLDPQGIRWIRTLVEELAAQDRAVVLSSHLLAEVQILAHDIVVMAHGQVTAVGSREAVLGDAATLEQFYFESLAAQGRTQR